MNINQMATTWTKKQSNIQRLSAELTVLDQRLKLLRAEKAEAEKMIDLAVQNGDSEDLNSFRQHLVKLEPKIKEAECCGFRLWVQMRESENPGFCYRLEQHEARLFEALAEKEKTARDRADREAKLTEARAAFSNANFACMSAENRVRTVLNEAI